MRNELFPGLKALPVIRDKDSAGKSWAQHACDIVESGYSLVSISRRAQESFERFLDEYRKLSREDKEEFSFPENTEGFLPIGLSYSGKPDATDLCEMFCYWHKYRGLRDNEFPQIRGLHEAVNVYEEELSSCASVLLDEISKIYETSEVFDVRNDSYIQLNAYRSELKRAGREYLQNLHEDGHLLTLLKPNAPGLLLLLNGQEHLADVMSDQIVVMAGSLLSALTGGQVRPMYHSVLNLTHPDMRISVGYNVNDMSEARRSFTENVIIPVRKIANENHVGFGNYRYKD